MNLGNEFGNYATQLDNLFILQKKDKCLSDYF